MSRTSDDGRLRRRLVGQLAVGNFLCQAAVPMNITPHAVELGRTKVARADRRQTARGDGAPRPDFATVL